MAEEKVDELTKKLDNAVSDIYSYIKIVDEKAEQNDKTLKFVTNLQTEQMKELIQTKSNDLRRFFEDAIRLQTEVVRNTYEGIISDLKSTYEQDLKNKDLENLKVYNQKIDTLKSAYENQISNLRTSMENDCTKKLNECYLNAKQDFDKLQQETIMRYEAEKNELITKCKQETQATADKVYLDAKEEFEKIIKSTSDEVYQKTKDEYEQEIARRCEESYNNGKNDTEAWFNDKLNGEIQRLTAEYENQIIEIKNNDEQILQEKLEENKTYYEAELSRKSEESYNNGKRDAEVWFNDKLNGEIGRLSSEYEKRIDEIKKYDEQILQEKLEEAYNNGKNDAEAWFNNKLNEEKERVKKETKEEMYAEMDEAARRNEEELKLFLDHYEAKIKPFKKLINIHETTDRRIRDIQRRIKNKINKTLGKTDKIVPYSGKNAECESIIEEFVPPEREEQYGEKND
ncbi:MAG: hypothetical protein ACI37T_00390 [Candidatus Gastranaerophilaceae bacterium]